MSALFDNALDLLRMSMTSYVSGNQDSTRKHATSAVFQSIELLLKEYLHQINPILIYKDIDQKITRNSLMVGCAEVLVRLDNLEPGVLDEQAKVIRNLQSEKNRIEHHSDEQQDEEKELVAQALKFVFYFMEFQLKKQPEQFFEPELLKQIRALVEDDNEREASAGRRLESWLKEKWPKWDLKAQEEPKEFTGTDPCPQCQSPYLVMEQISEPYCFWCCSEIPAEYCDTCCQAKIVGVACCEHDDRLDPVDEPIRFSAGIIPRF